MERVWLLKTCDRKYCLVESTAWWYACTKSNFEKIVVPCSDAEKGEPGTIGEVW